MDLSRSQKREVPDAPIASPHHEHQTISKDNACPEGNDNQTPTAAAAYARPLHGWKWVLVVSAILTSTFLFGLDNTIVADIQPAVVAEFGSVNHLPWISVAFLASAASTTLFWGQMYGQWNTKWLYISCIVLFEVGSAVCGAAPSMDALIVGRAICGIGGTGMYTGVLTLISMLAAEQERATYFGLSGLVWGIGTILGPIIGGAFTSGPAGWRWAFYINICIAGLCAPVYLFIIPVMQPRSGASIFDRMSEVDLIGSTLLAGAYISGLMAISFGGVLFTWNSGQIIALFVIAFILIVVFLVQQTWSIGTTYARRAFPLHFFKNRALCIVFVLECCASALVFVPVYFIPLYFQFVKQDSALVAGVRLLPLVIFLVVTIVVNGFVTSANGRYMPWFFAGGTLGLVGSALLFTVNIDTSNAKIYGYSILIGTGAGCFLQLPFSVVQSLVSPDQIPKAIGFVTFAQLGAPSAVLAIINAVFLNETTNKIVRAVSNLPRDTVISILSGVGSDAFAQLDGQTQQLVLRYIVEGLSKGYIVAMSSGALALVLSLFLSRKSMFDTQSASEK